MEKKEINIEGHKVLAANLRKTFEKIGDKEVCLQVVDEINKTIGLLGEIQTCKHATRLLIWECTYYIIDFLRRNKQMDRKKECFDVEIYDVLEKTMEKLFYELQFKWKKSV